MGRSTDVTPPTRGNGGRYTRGAVALHWLTAAAFAFQVGLGFNMGGARGPATFAAFQLHKSVGITILMLTLARIGWRLTHRPPAMPAALAPLDRALAHAVHIGFYLLLLALPLSGWLIVSSSRLAIPTYLYGTIPWPHVPGIAGLAPVAKQGVNDVAARAHLAMVWIALAAIALHVAGALKHQFLERGDYLARMVPAAGRPLRWAALPILVGFAALFAIGRTIHLSPVALAAKGGDRPALDPAPPPPAAAPNPAPAPPATASDPTQTQTQAPPQTETQTPGEDAPPAPSSKWTVRMERSSLRFHTAWSQGQVDGGFARWKAAVTFDPAALDHASATITIDMASVRAAAPDQQSALPGDDWFAAATHPQAVWRSTRFKHLGGNRYTAEGRLTVRGIDHPLPVQFTVDIADDVAKVAGTARIDRTVYGVGQGEWASTADLPALVGLAFSIEAYREGAKHGRGAAR